MIQGKMEVKKDGLRQTQDGLWKLTLTVHPDDFPQGMAMAPMGTRYMVGYAEIGDDDQPVARQERQKEEDPGKRAVTRAALLCRDSDFIEWMLGRMPDPDFMDVEEECAKVLRAKCGIASRSELSTNEEARRKFEALETSFRYRDQMR